MAFTHGVYTAEVPTSILAPTQNESGLPVIIGTAPVHLGNPENVNKIVLCYTYEEAVEQLGYSDDWEKYTLCEHMYSHFILYRQSPCVFINVYSPSKHRNNVSNVTVADITGEGYGDRGMKLIQYVFPATRLIPGLIGCPKWSENPEVAAEMVAQAESISGVFSCSAVVDIPSSSYDEGGCPTFTTVPGWKNNNNYNSSREIVCWPKLKLGDKVFHMSTHVIGLLNRVDSNHEGVPFKSPSNELLQADSCINAEGLPMTLHISHANYLNSQGIVTALNWIGGFRLWGNRTGCYPGVTDVKDCFISVRRMMDFLSNQFVTTFWQTTDQPMTPRLIRTIVNSFNLYLNSLVAREMLLGGRIEFRETENVMTDLLNGVLKFHVYITPPMPAETIEGIFEYDTEYLNVLYEALQ